MAYKLEMTEEEAALLVRLLTNKAKEIRAWEAATGDPRRRGEYFKVAGLLRQVHAEGGGE